MKIKTKDEKHGYIIPFHFAFNNGACMYKKI